LSETPRFTWLLVCALLLIWPFPILGLDNIFVPVARLIQLATSLTILVVLEGAGGMVGALLGLLWAHALVYGLILLGLTTVIARRVRSRLSDRVGLGLVAVSILALFLWALFAPPYDTPFHHSDAHASLLDLYR
jgi:hypothetical protein